MPVADSLRSYGRARVSQSSSEPLTLGHLSAATLARIGFPAARPPRSWSGFRELSASRMDDARSSLDQEWRPRRRPSGRISGYPVAQVNERQRRTEATRAVGQGFAFRRYDRGEVPAHCLESGDSVRRSLPPWRSLACAVARWSADCCAAGLGQNRSHASGRVWGPCSNRQ